MIEDEIYPLTIIKDRYSGAYSKGIFIAMNCYPDEVPGDITAGDAECLNYWYSNYKDKQPMCGVGDTIEEAIAELQKKVNAQEESMIRSIKDSTTLIPHEQQVCSSVYSVKLKELGIIQKSFFVWRCYYRDTYYIENRVDTYYVDPNELFAAFTVAELGQMLPSCIEQYYWLYITKWSETCIQYKNDNFNLIAEINDENEANARARMLITLIKNNLVTTDEINNTLAA